MSTPFVNVTPYPDVNALLQELLSGVETVLGDHFVGMYLYGSLASGDFDQSSDIDFVVVTDNEIADDRFLALREMHARIAASPSRWAMELEGSYIPQVALRRYDPANAQHPRIDRGEGDLVMAQHGSDWVIQRHVLREHGVVVAGPDLRTLIDPVASNELRWAVLADLREWWAPMLDDPVRLQKRGYQCYAVLTMCRMLYTLEGGAVVSKPVAARWAQETLGGRWGPLIERALVGRHNPQVKAQPDDVNATQEIIRYTLERSQQFEIPAKQAQRRGSSK